MRQLTVGSLFAGIGGFDLGLERAGMRVIWQSEIDPYACAVLRKHWPTVPNLGDIRGITAAYLADPDGEWKLQPEGSEPTLGRWPCDRRPDVLCGGFPCQDISNAGKRAGIDGERSGLWSEYARVIGELRPRYVIVENVAALLGRGIERVLGDLAALGFDAEWHCIPASAAGAPHRRDRVWIVAHSVELPEWRGAGRREAAGGRSYHDAQRPSDNSCDVADADQPRLLQGRLGEILRECADQRTARTRGPYGWDESEWFAVTGLGRVSDGVRNRVDRLRCLGNAIVPQIAEIIGRAIVSSAIAGNSHG